MKTIKLIAIGALMTTFTMGCAISQKLPSVTVGGAANHKSVLGATVSKEAITVTAPLVDVNVPLPTLKGDKK
tara:strand:+ start:420 stop:635 length:216 start_codon:yes stop_codon:yes gene_type:complete